MKDLDWNEIARRLPPVPDTRVQTGRLSVRDWWMLKAASVALGKSISSNSQHLVGEQVQRYQDEWLENISFLAAQDGVSIEEKFVQLCLGKD